MSERDRAEEAVPRSNAVALIISDGEDKLLILWHVKYCFWTVPLGKIERGETGISAAHREAYEELGIVAGNVELLDTIYKPIEVDDYSDITIAFCQVNSYSGTIANREPHKHGQFRFLHPSDFASLEPLSFPTSVIADRFKVGAGLIDVNRPAASSCNGDVPLAAKTSSM